MLQRQAAVINFSQGLSTKADVNQLSFGQFVNLSNSVFDTLGRLTKRNGYAALSGNNGSSSSYITTYKGSLVSVGDTLSTYVPNITNWENAGNFQSVQIDTASLIKNMYSQAYVDSAVSPNNLLCLVYNEPQASGNVYKYAVVNKANGQSVVAPTIFPTTLGTVSFSPRVFAYKNHFLLFFNTKQSAVGSNSYNLSYTSINSQAPNQSLGTTSNFSTNYQPSGSCSFDGVVASSTLYLAWNGFGSNSTAEGTRAGFLQGYGMPFASLEKNIASASASLMSVTADPFGPVIYASFYDTTGSGFSAPGIYNVPMDQNLSLIHGATRQAVGSVSNVASFAKLGDPGISTCTIFYENQRYYPYPAQSVGSTFNEAIVSYSVTAQGSLSASTNVVRSVGLASKAFITNSQGYFMSAYQSTYQSTYFLMNSGGGVVAKLAYGNGGGLLGQGLPSVSIVGSSASIGYLLKDFIQPVNKLTGVASTTQTAGIYSQTGINQANFNYSTSKLQSSEIGSNLHFNAGFLWMYDGFKPVEHNFYLFPDNISILGSGSGSLSLQTYYYQFTYEWTDNQGNIHRSAPSVPVGLTLASGTSQILLNIPTPRISYKFLTNFLNGGTPVVTNPIRLVSYRWSTAQPVYYQQTSVVLDAQALSLEFIPLTDQLADSQIIGNNIIYTNGGVVENIQAPGSPAMTLFDDRLWLINAENQNELWYSKQVIENTPVETSDLFTLFVAPTTSSNQSTGSMRCITPMDDKLIIFKQGAIYYINGSGPDNTGANSQYSQPIFITGATGCSNNRSIVLIPNGLMFQSDKGIWLLGRDLSIKYIGQGVEAYNSSVVTSAVAIPNTNQVRFGLSTGEVLMYDYFVDQWGTFDGTPNISSTIFSGVHTFLNSNGRVFQETPNKYFDGSTAVVMSFKTGFVNLNNLEGYKRVYRGYFLGTYLTPHTFTMGVSYDYVSTVSQTITVVPKNTSANTLEQWRLNFERQQCQSFQLTFNEIYNSTAGSSAQGLTVSGFNIIAGVKGSEPQNIAPINRRG